MANSITAVFNAGQTRTVAEAPLYQWSYGQKLVFEGLQLPAAYQVDFSNFEFSGDSIPQTGGADGVTVPIAVLETGREVYAFVWLQDANSGRTEYCVEIRVIPRPAPAPGTPSPEEESALAEAITALNEGVEAAEDSAEDAEAWAVGERGGTPVDENDPAYHNNAKYYAEQAGTGGGGTGNYNELSNKPKINGVTLSGDKSAADLGLAAAEDIPTVPVDSVNGKTGEVVLNATDVGAGTYSKPSGGIPKTDLASAVQASLDKADAALPKAGGTMSGPIAMGSNKITGLADGTADSDAVNLGQVSGLISTNTAFYRGSFASKAALLAVAWQTTNPAAANYVTNNDYAVVQDDETQSDECWRYVYVAGSGWAAQYRINESPLTTAQLAALNSGATAENIASIEQKYVKPSGGIPASNLASGVIPSVPSAATATPANLGTAAVGTSTKYAREDHIHNKPSYTASEVGAIAAPSSPASGAFLVWNGSAWVAQTLSTWQASSY